MFDRIKNWLTRSSVRPLSLLSERPGEWGPPSYILGSVGNTDEALTLSPVFAALDLYQRAIALTPLVTYKRTDEGRQRAETHPAYTVLHDSPNPAQTRTTFFEQLVNDYFLYGEFCALIIWKNNNNLNSIHPISPDKILEVNLDADWNKTYRIRMGDNTVEDVDASDIVHIIKNSRDGIRGRGILDFAGESLGLHKQIQISANGYYRNSVRPPAYVKTNNPGSKQEATNAQADEFNKKYAGADNSGRVPFISNGDILPFPSTTAEEQQLVTALQASVADVARWFGISPLLLADLSRGTYSNLAADNAAFFQRSLQPILAKIQDELNLKLFGSGDVYCEFLTRAILAGDPAEEQAILNGYIANGVMTVAEAREVLNLPPLPGTDKPMQPLNMGPVQPQETTGAETPTSLSL